LTKAYSKFRIKSRRSEANKKKGRVGDGKTVPPNEGSGPLFGLPRMRRQEEVQAASVYKTSAKQRIRKHKGGKPR